MPKNFYNTPMDTAQVRYRYEKATQVKSPVRHLCIKCKKAEIDPKFIPKICKTCIDIK